MSGDVGRQEDESGPCLSDSPAHSLAFMAAEIVEDDDVARRRRLNSFEKLPPFQNVADALERLVADNRSRESQIKCQTT